MVARNTRLDPKLVKLLLDFVSQKSSIIERKANGGYYIKDQDNYSRVFWHNLEKYVGAYGPCLEALKDGSASMKKVHAAVDRSILAMSYARCEFPSNPMLADILFQNRIHNLLDIGCGTASLLVTLGVRDKNFLGWGLDLNKEMCRLARNRIHQAGLAKRIRIIHGDGRHASQFVPDPMVKRIAALSASSILNSFLGGKRNNRAISFLSSLKQRFPNRLLFVADYYGKLGSSSSRADHCPETMVHDLVQAISGQGIPPPSLRGWLQIYRGADCKLLHAVEGRNNGIDWFIHVVEL